MNTRTLLFVALLGAVAQAQIVVTPAGPHQQAQHKPYPVPGMYDLTLTNTQSGIDEDFLFYVPPTGGTKRPLVVGFHSFGVSENSMLNTPFFTEAQNRNWYAVAPLGTYQENFGVWHTQTNVEDVLDWILTNYYIKKNKIYGIGFSMGGGGVATYAARHLDPDKAMFAAFVNHTGGMSLTFTHANDPGSHFYLEHPLLLQGPPTGSFLFGYHRSSVIDLDLGLNVDPSVSMARNLTHVDVYNFYSENDFGVPGDYLKPSVDAFNTYLDQVQMSAANTAGAGGGSTQLVVKPNNGTGPIHSWSELDFTAAFDFLAQQTRTIPTASGAPQLLIDRDGSWFHMDVEQDTAGSFTRFTWGLAAGQNRFGVLAAANLKKITLDTVKLNFDISTPANPLIIQIDAADNTQEIVVLTDFANPPFSVTGLSAGGSAVHDPGAQTLTLTEPDGMFHSIIITP